MNTERIWQHLDAPGWEHVRINPEHPGWTVFDSIIVREHNGQVLRGGYTLVTDKQWRTLELRLMMETAPGSMEGIHLLTEGDGRWTDANEQPIPELDGCLDVDIQWSPMTNSLPINRIGMDVGEQHTIKVVYISLPDLILRTVDQTYHRESEFGYQYTNQANASEFRIETDSEAFVLNYPERFGSTFPR